MDQSLKKKADSNFFRLDPVPPQQDARAEDLSDAVMRIDKVESFDMNQLNIDQQAANNELRIVDAEREFLASKVQNVGQEKAGPASDG